MHHLEEASLRETTSEKKEEEEEHLAAEALALRRTWT